MREPLNHITERCGLVNDAIGLKSLYNAIFNAEHVGSRILRDIEPENLFFIFGQAMQSIGHAPIEVTFSKPTFNEGKNVSRNRHNEQRNSNDEGKPKHRTVILRELKYTDKLEKLLIGKKQECGHDAKRYEVAWSELQELKKRLCNFGDHIKMPNSY